MRPVRTCVHRIGEKFLAPSRRRLTFLLACLYTGDARKTIVRVGGQEHFLVGTSIREERDRYVIEKLVVQPEHWRYDPQSGCPRPGNDLQHPVGRRPPRVRLRDQYRYREVRHRDRLDERRSEERLGQEDQLISGNSSSP